MRTIATHKVNPANDQIEIKVLDEPGSGGAHHHYGLSIPTGTTLLAFQNGPIAEASVNGITHEALLAVLIDRLECFQAGPYACTENREALASLKMAQHWLHERTKGRMVRGVEGTHAV